MDIKSLLAAAAAAPMLMVLAPVQALADTPTATTDVDSLTVTAQRREESANSIGMPIQAFSGERLDELRVTNVQDLSAVAPSFSVSQSYQGVPIYTLRGIGFNTINLSATSTVGSYVDEVAYPYPFMMTGPVFDIERVEVLKGPQGTLYGRNTTAGLIDFITAKPTDSLQGSATAEVGNYAAYNIEGFISGPLTDNLQARLALRYDNSNQGWQVSNTRPNERQGEVHKLGMRLSFAWQPTEDIDVDLSLSGWLNNSDTVVAQGIGFTPNTTPGSGSFGVFNTPGLATYISTHVPTDATQADWAPQSQRGQDIGSGTGLPGPLEEDNSFGAVALRLTWRVSDNMRLVSLSGYNHLERSALFDWSGSPYEILIQQASGKISSISEELRLEGEFDRGNWLIGGYAARDDITDNNRTMLGQNANVGAIRYNGNLLLGTFFNSGGYTATQMAQAFRTYRDLGEMKSETWSVFANGSYDLTEALKLNLGIRYTQDDQTYVGCSADFNGNMLPNVNVVNRYLVTTIYGVTPAPITANACLTYNPPTNTFTQLAHSLSENNVAWRIALDWQATDTVLLYASVSQGAKAGNTPINAANISTQQEPARQETLLAYEVGMKAGLFERRVQLNLSGFYYDYRDKQLSVYFADPIYTALARLANVPDSEAWGVDGDFTWRPNENFTLIGSATWVETRINNYNGINAAGQPQLFDKRHFPYSPTFQGSVTGLYNREINDRIGVQAALTARYQNDSASDLGDDPRFAIDGYTLVNASIGVHDNDDKWRLSFWAQNLTDVYYWTSVSSNANVVVRFPGRPRTFGVSFTVNWQ